MYLAWGATVNTTYKLSAPMELALSQGNRMERGKQIHKTVSDSAKCYEKNRMIGWSK